VDVNNDGKVTDGANDSERNFLYINKGDGTFDIRASSPDLLSTAMAVNRSMDWA